VEKEETVVPKGKERGCVKKERRLTRAQDQGKVPSESVNADEGGKEIWNLCGKRGVVYHLSRGVKIRTETTRKRPGVAGGGKRRSLKKGGLADLGRRGTINSADQSEKG